MDKFVVDIDAVLDEFEESEIKSQPVSAAPPRQIKVHSVMTSAPPAPSPSPSPPPVISKKMTKLNGSTGATKTPEPESVKSSPAVKPKTPLKTQAAALPSAKVASPGVSSEQFEEFLRKKSIENAHLLSAQNSPVLQRYRSSSVGLSVKRSITPVEQVSNREQSDASVDRVMAVPPAAAFEEASQKQVEMNYETDRNTQSIRRDGEPEPRDRESGCPRDLNLLFQSHSERLRDSGPDLTRSSSINTIEATQTVVDESDNNKLVEGNTDAKNVTLKHSPFKPRASNYDRIISFDLSAVEVTDDELHVLEEEVRNDRAPSRESQDSETSIKPVDPQQVIGSETAENVVNNNNTELPNPSESLNSGFEVPSEAVAETTVPSSESLSQEIQIENHATTVPCAPTPTDKVEIEKSSQKTPEPDLSLPNQKAAPDTCDGSEMGAVGGGAETVVAPSESLLGKVRPMWIHDEDAPICMNCGQDFTIFRRRHHCRACGKVLCGNCCKDRASLQFMDGELARVCSYCIEILNKVERWSRPDPSNPMEYCSTVSPLAQISSTAQLPPPTVMVPVGVLKKGGEKSNTSGSGLGGSSECSKSVMFSDGIRPGGDLTDLDIPSTPPAQRAPQRTLKQLATGRSKANVARKYRKYVSITDSLGCLPIVLLSNKFKPYDQPMPAGTLFNLLQDPSLPPVSFELTRHKVQLRVKIVTLDCCLGSRVWSFCSEGLAAFGQEEVAFILEYHTDDELAVPRDVFKLYKIIYENACIGTPVIQMDHLLFPGGLLNSNEHAGVLFLRTSLQCTQKIVTPIHENNYLVAMLIMRSEVPWAKLFPLRLPLRLGAEFRYYPCPLVSQRFRKAVYFDGDQHSIMSILADFRNYQYTIQNIPGLVIHVVGKTYTIFAPRNRYDLMMKASTTNENILAIGSNFSSSADSHLVCIQRDDGSFQSQTINIASSPVKVTGASFLVFSGALKSNSGFTAKSSIVEDGILVQISPHDMSNLKQAIHAMEDYRIVCKETSKQTSEATDTVEEEYVELMWVENELTRNESVLSAVDGSSLAGIPSCKIFSGTDYSNDKFVLRWTEVFFLASKDTELDLPDPNRLIEATARTMCVALLPHAFKLYEKDLKKVALRISLDPEQFGYELGAGGSPLNGEFLAEVDNALVPIITSLDGSHQPMTIELVFYVLLK